MNNGHRFLQPDWIRFGACRIPPDTVVLFVSLNHNLQLSLFAAKCEAAVMGNRTIKPKTMAFSQKRVECPLWVGSEVPP